MMENGMMTGFFWFTTGFAILFTILFVVALVLAIIWLWRKVREEPHGERGDAMRVLERRYARGEITGEEFRRMRAELRGEEDIPPGEAYG